MPSPALAPSLSSSPWPCAYTAVGAVASASARTPSLKAIVPLTRVATTRTGGMRLMLFNRSPPKSPNSSPTGRRKPTPIRRRKLPRMTRATARGRRPSAPQRPFADSRRWRRHPLRHHPQACPCVRLTRHPHVPHKPPLPHQAATCDPTSLITSHILCHVICHGQSWSSILSPTRSCSRWRTALEWTTPCLTISHRRRAAQGIARRITRRRAAAGPEAEAVGPAHQVARSMLRRWSVLLLASRASALSAANGRGGAPPTALRIASTVTSAAGTPALPCTVSTLRPRVSSSLRVA